MNTLNYIGSKQTLCHILTNIITTEISDLNSLSFLDMFAGTGSIGFRFQELTNTCYANDLEYYSFIINNALLKCNYSIKLQKFIDYFNTLDGIDGLIYTNYSLNDNCERMFFTPENARKCDAIRNYIEELKITNSIDINEYYFLLASLIVSMDKVANTSCVYGAYLKEFKNSALKNLVLIPIHKKKILGEQNNVYNTLAENFALPESEYYDVIYLDPPYNQRQYSANYSPLNYIAHYNKDIILKGKTALIENYNKSNFCKKSEVKKVFTDLISGLKCNYLIISYNNEGLMSIEDFQKILLKKGMVKLYKIKYNKFKSNQNVEKKYVEEYLWVVDTSKKSNLILEIELEMVK